MNLELKPQTKEKLDLLFVKCKEVDNNIQIQVSQQEIDKMIVIIISLGRIFQFYLQEYLNPEGAWDYTWHRMF